MMVERDKEEARREKMGMERRYEPSERKLVSPL